MEIYLKKKTLAYYIYHMESTLFFIAIRKRKFESNSGEGLQKDYR